jgi:serine/threonine protein kinase/Flp pilus assembly protein TadD
VANKCPKCDFDNTADSKFCKECGTQLILAEGPQVSKTLTLETKTEGLKRGTVFAGRYEILESLGTGGMGAVYRVYDRQLGEEAALKLIHPEIAANLKSIDRFKNELKVARRITHKSVCKMYDLGESGGTSYITMEYVTGEDLKSVIHRMGTLTMRKSVSIAKQVAEGLGEAHKLGIIHRDLKPGNIMIDEDGNAKIMDFGIARSLTSAETTAEDAIIGTPDYMSPEQVEGKSADARADIYALGIILFEMVTGRVPFEGDTPLSVAHKHKYEQPPEPKKINPQVPDSLSCLILRCLEKDRARRYASAADLLEELERIEQSLPATGRAVRSKRPLTSKQITVTFGVRRLVLPALVILGVAAAAVIIRLTLLSKKPPLVPAGMPSLAIVYFENNSGDEKLDNWRSALAELLITDLSQSKYIRVVPGDEMYSILQKLGLLGAKKYSSEDLSKIAAAGRASHILKGSFVTAGENFIITAAIQRIDTKETLSSHRVEAKGEENIIPRIDDLSQQIKLDLDLTRVQLANDIDRELGKITTSSPEAYRFYSDGWKLITQGKFRESIPLLQRALAIDPEFAMAYRLIGIAYGGAGQPVEARQSIEKAMTLRERISDRERYLIEGQFYANRGEKYFDRAIEAYSNLFKIYPEDYIWYNNLGAIYFRLEEWDLARDLFEKARKGNPESIISLSNLAGAWMAKGEYGKAKEILEGYLRQFPDNATVRQDIAYLLLLEKKFDLALAEAEKAETLAPSDPNNDKIKGDLSLYRDDLGQAESEYRRLSERKEPPAQRLGLGRLSMLAILRGKFAGLRARMDGVWEKLPGLEQGEPRLLERYYSAWYFLRTGDAETALKRFQELLDRAVAAEDLDYQRGALHGKGLAYVAMNRPDEALGSAEELKKIVENGLYKKAIRLYDHLMGCIELQRKSLKPAIENLEKAVGLMPFENEAWSVGDQALLLEPLAQAYAEAGQQEKALETYQRITGLTSGRLAWGDIYAKTFYWLGKLAEKQGNRSRAREHYLKFLDLWEDADPGIPEVEDASKSLAGLTK